jgi:ATP-dependent Clp protease, protease subunit
MFKPYLKSIVRDGTKGRSGLGVELFRLDAVGDEVELTAEEAEEAEEVKGEETGTAIMRVYEEIGEDFFTGEGVTAKKFAAQLDEFGDIKRLHLHINSLGGDAFAAQCIHNVIRDHSSKKTSYIDGVAASAATLIACAANEVVARVNSTYMIHHPWGVCMGDADEMEKSARDLRVFTRSIVNVYKDQVGDKIDEDKIRSLMDEETWMDAEDALAYGFVDRIKGRIKAIAKVNRTQILCSGRLMDLARYHYRNAPKFPTLKAPDRKAAEAELKPKEHEAMEAELENKPAAKADKKTKYMTIDDVAPELVATIQANARVAERARLAALDAMAAPGCDEIIAKAKADGLQPDDIVMQCYNLTRANLASAEKKGALARDAAAAGGLRAGDAPATPTPVDPQARLKALVINAAKATRPPGSRVQAHVANN